MTEVLVGLVGSALIGGKAATIINTVGTELVIGTVTSSTHAIRSMLTYFTTSTQPGISDIITELKNIDLEFTILIIEQVVLEQDSKNLPASITKALIGVNEILTLIREELNKIKESIDYHNTKYWSNWRSFASNCNMAQIKKHDDILKYRYGVLTELLKIYYRK